MNTKVEEALGVLEEAEERIESSKERCESLGQLFQAGKDGELTARIVSARTTLAAHIAQQDAMIARMREALNACIDYGSMTGDEWVTDKARAALNQEQGK